MITQNQSKQSFLESKVKDLETYLTTNRTYSGSNEKPKNSKIFSNHIESKGCKGELILLKDESCKNTVPSKIKYLLKAVPGGSVKATDDPEDALVSFSELSTKEYDKSKQGSIKKKLNPYKIDYFKNHPDVKNNLRCDSQIQYQNSSLDEKHKRSKSQTMNSVKSKKMSKSQEQSMLQKESQNQVSNSKISYHLINEYLENPLKQTDSNMLIDMSYNCNDKSYENEGHKRQGSRSRGKREKLINYPAKSYIKAPNVFIGKKRFQAAGQNMKNSFKSFDQRRALTKLDNREGSFDDPSNYLYSNPLRSSSACHKKSMSNERNSSAHKQKSSKIGMKSFVDPSSIKPSSQRNKKMTKRPNLNGMKRISATQAMINLIKNCKNK